MIVAHWPSVTGETDRRDWRSMTISPKAGSAFISARVTGRYNARTG